MRKGSSVEYVVADRNGSRPLAPESMLAGESVLGKLRTRSRSTRLPVTWLPVMWLPGKYVAPMAPACGSAAVLSPSPLPPPLVLRTAVMPMSSVAVMRAVAAKPTTEIINYDGSTKCLRTVVGAHSPVPSVSP